jgi:uracil-DNA glycosylase
MGYRLRLIELETDECDRCLRGTTAAPRAMGAGPEKAKIVVAVPAMTAEMAAIGHPIPPASRAWEFFDWQFTTCSYPINGVRFTGLVRCPGRALSEPGCVAQCEDHLAHELAAVGAEVLLLYGRVTPESFEGSRRFRSSGDAVTFACSDDVIVPVLFIDDLDTVLRQAYPLYIAPESPLAKNITAISRAVEVATGSNPLVGRTLVDLVRPFAQQFMGRTPAQILLAKILQDHGLDPDAEVDWLEKVRLRFEAVGFPRGWAQQTAIADIRRLFLEGSTGYRVIQSPESMRGKSKRRHRRYWQTTPNKRPNDNLIAMHLTGEMPLSSFGLESTQVLTLDLDRHGDLQRVNFEETLKLAMAAFPDALPIRSSSSGGVHLLLFFDQPVSYQFLVSIARRRLEKFDLGVVHRGPCRFVRVEVPEQGVRLPLGQESYLLTPGFNETSPVPEMLRALVQHAHEHAVAFDQVFAEELGEVRDEIRRQQLPDTIESKIKTAEALYYQALDKNLPYLTPGEIESRLESDLSGYLFSAAPMFIRRVYAVGIEAFGTRTMMTRKIAVWLATTGIEPEEAIEILTTWIESRDHMSRDIQADPEWVKEELTSVVHNAFKFARQKGYASQEVPAGYVRWLIDHLEVLPDPEALRQNPPTARPGSMRRMRNPSAWLKNRRGGTPVPLSPPNGPHIGTRHVHGLELGYDMIARLRAAGGKTHIGAEWAAKRGGSKGEYATWIRHWEGHGLIKCTDNYDLQNKQARKFELVLQIEGPMINSIWEGLAMVTTKEEVLRLFPHLPSTVRKIEMLRKRLASNKNQGRS